MGRGGVNGARSPPAWVSCTGLDGCSYGSYGARGHIVARSPPAWASFISSDTQYFGILSVPAARGLDRTQCYQAGWVTATKDWLMLKL